jgi:hypothetical protein
MVGFPLSQMAIRLANKWASLSRLVMENQWAQDQGLVAQSDSPTLYLQREPAGSHRNLRP